MQNLWYKVRDVLWNVFNRPTASDFIDIIIVTVLIYGLFMLTKETRASAVLKGLLMLFIASWLSELSGLTALNWLLTNVINNGAVVLVILFQPEIRKALEQIGRGSFRDSTRNRDAQTNERIVSELTHCLLTLSRRRIGALIVVEQRIGLKDVVETGTLLHADISSALLENIFEPNTPLHDGAVLVRGDRVMAAACLLTLSEDNAISRELGTRHRAAIGITETTDAIALIVSEETGIISMAREGKLTRHMDQASLTTLLSNLYAQKKSNLFSVIANKTKRMKNRGQ